MESLLGVCGPKSLKSVPVPSGPLLKFRDPRISRIWSGRPGKGI